MSEAHIEKRGADKFSSTLKALRNMYVLCAQLHQILFATMQYYISLEC